MRSVGWHRSRTTAQGFTFVELLVATVVMSMTLLGAYVVFGQATATERMISIRWRERAAAEAVADHLAHVIERCVMIGQTPPLVARDLGDDGHELLIVYAGAGGPRSQPADHAMQRRRYSWGSDRASPGGHVQLQVMVLAGSLNLTLDDRQRQLPEVQQWDLIPAAIIGQGIDNLSLSYRAQGSSRSRWTTEWDDPERLPLVRIEVQIGQQFVERVVSPPVRGALVSKD
jgi:prepilin-type N-terminal cleavage/methylation domain-containing protein